MTAVHNLQRRIWSLALLTLAVAPALARAAWRRD
jgi:hypothetical protein